MRLTALIPIVIQLSMAVSIFCVGLNARFADLTSVAERPGSLARCVLAMNVVMPAVAVLAAVLFDLSVVVEIALVALALSPIPPILPHKEVKAGGSPSYVLGVTVAAALLSIVFVPVVARILGEFFGRPVHVTSAEIGKIVVTSIFLPLLAGVAVRRLWPAVASRILRPLSLAGTVLLIAAFVPVLVGQRHMMAALVGNFSVLAIVAFVAIGLAVGHALGGPDPDHRTVLALSTATRHPAVAMAVVHESQDKPAILAAVLLVLIVGGVVSVPYVMWRRRTHDAALVTR